MSILANFFKLDLSYPKIVLSVFGQAHYFLIAIFLFKYDLVEKLDSPLLLDFDFYFILLLSVLFSITWFLMNVGITTILLFFEHDKNYEDATTIFINTMISSVAYLTISLLFNFALGLDFTHFIVTAYLFLAFKVLWTIFKSKLKENN